jgi:hypothetical protein
MLYLPPESPPSLQRLEWQIANLIGQTLDIDLDAIDGVARVGKHGSGRQAPLDAPDPEAHGGWLQYL